MIDVDSTLLKQSGSLLAPMPPFITARSIAERLSWVPSLQRQFRQQVQSNPIAGWSLNNDDLFASIAELLALPSGLNYFEDRVRGFDSKGRGLLNAIRNGALRQSFSGMKPKLRSDLDIMSALVRQELWELGAWIAWTILERPSVIGKQGDGPEALEAIAAQTEITDRLGEYWTGKGWLRNANGPPNPMTPVRLLPNASEAPTIASEWQEAISTLVKQLDAAEVGEDLSQALEIAGRRLATLREQWAELSTGALQSRRDLALMGLADALRAAGTVLPATSNIADRVSDVLRHKLDIAETTRIGMFEAAAESLKTLVGNSQAAEGAETEARARQLDEDSDAADKAYVDARAKRRASLITLTNFIEVDLSQLMMEQPKASAHIGKELTEPFLDQKTQDAAFVEGRDLTIKSPQAHSQPEQTFGSDEIIADANRGVVEFPSNQPTNDEGFADVSESVSLTPDMVTESSIEGAIVDSMNSKRYGLAFHLASAAGICGRSAGVPPPVVFEALAVGASASATRLMPAVSRYKNLQEDVLLALDESWTPATRLIVFAGAVRPALFAPDSSGVEILGRANMGEFGAGLHGLCQFITTEIRGRGLSLTPADFEPATADSQRRAAERAARTTLLDFAQVAPKRRLKFHRAMVIWTDVFRQGPVAQAIAAVEQNAPNAVALAKAAEAWINEDSAEARVDDLDARQRSGREQRVEAGARLRLIEWLRQTAQHLQNWISAQEARDRVQVEHVLEKLHQLRGHLSAAQMDLKLPFEGPPLLHAAVKAAREVISELFEQSGPAADSPITLDMALDGDLLLFSPPVMRVDTDLLSQEQAEIILRQGPDIAGTPANFDSAFQNMIRAGRFGAASQLLDHLVLAGAERSPLEQSLKNAAEARSVETVARAEKLRSKIDDLLGADQSALIDVGLSTRLDAVLGVLRAEVNSPSNQLDFVELDAQLVLIESDVSDGFEILLEPLRKRIDELRTRGRDVTEFDELATTHDLATLVEHLDAASNDIDWTAKTAGALLKHFVSHCLTDAYERISPGERSVAVLIAAARNQQKTEAADFSTLAENEAQRSVELLEAWRDLRQPKIQRHLALSKLMQALGFASAEAKEVGPLGNASGAPRRLRLQTEKIADRDICRIPAFGSEAKGNYEIILADPSAIQTGEELIRWRGQLPADTTVPAFIIVAGHLPLKSRNHFIRLVREKGGSASCGLIDEAMIVFLAAQPARRRAYFFDLALPMGLVQPYADTAARTSQEMFYGRARELDDLWDRNGSCLVYGGRQLGKTALLKQIQLRYHQPPNQLVIFGDLQAELSGINGGGIWQWLGRKLKSEPGFGNRDLRTQVEVESAIRGWLSADNRRRILVLADEADEFLRSELLSQYTNLAKLRDLMQATERYCKFVFAGLHDVQRLARTPNSPLLHFGTPVRVGPLMGTDLPEARAMVEGPLSAAGFLFETPSLTGRMLSQVGYYPSLLQAYGKGLIERLNRSIGRRHVPSGGSPLPLVITVKDLEETFQDKDLRNNIQTKFENTLNLDERYRLITFVMLVDSLARRDQGTLPIGLKDAEVQRLALQWWPQGFAEDQSLDAFQGLLQEMIGLGVLIEQDDGRFVIRSARIADMLGGREQIERKLMELSDQPAPSRLDTGALRRPHGIAPAPLTARQEMMLLSDEKPASAVQILVSSQALGMDHIAVSLSDMSESDVRVIPRSYQNLRQLEQVVDDVASKLGAKERGLLILSGPWLGAEMRVLAARNARVRQAQRDGRYGMRILLVPLHVEWRDLDTAIDSSDIISLAPLGESSLSHFVRRYWRGGAALDEAQIKLIRQLTGGFPYFLQQPKGRTAVELFDALRNSMEEFYRSPKLLGILGLDDQALMNALTIIRELGYDRDVSDDLMRQDGIDDPQAALRQLDRLGIIERHASPNSFEPETRVNPMVEAALARPQN